MGRRQRRRSRRLIWSEPRRPYLSSGLLRFVGLYAALFLAFGVASPFLAAFLHGRGLLPPGIGLVLAAGTAVRLLAGPLFGRLADRCRAPRPVLVGCLAAAGMAAFCYLPATGLVSLLLVGVAQAAALAPTTAIADALTLAAINRGQRLEYGWVRAAGSGAFIAGTILAGQAVARFGLDAIIWLNGALLGLAAGAGTLIPDRLDVLPLVHPREGRFTALFSLPGFTRMMLVAALIQGSHAFHDGFVVVHWRAAGIGDRTIGVLWAEAVASEVLVFLLLGPALLSRLGAGGASVLAAVAGILRWGVLAETTSVLASALVEPLHGFTFALQHLACMRLIGAVVPPRFAASAQTFYGNVAVGTTTAAMLLGSGLLYEQIGARGFWVMAAFCSAAVPLALSLPKSTSVKNGGDRGNV
ncbi:MAG TPA: MFS transporter [Rhodopila sp.]|nr:MFS transporter [Rhodopila sp.]